MWEFDTLKHIARRAHGIQLHKNIFGQHDFSYVGPISRRCMDLQTINANTFISAAMPLL